MRSSLLVAAALVSGCVALPGASDPAAPSAQAPPGAGNALEKHWDILPYGFGELNFRMSEGGGIAYVLLMSTPLDWDLHSHDGTQVLIHAQGNGDTRSTFVAPVDGTYSLFVEAAAQGGKVTLNMTGAFEVVS